MRPEGNTLNLVSLQYIKTQLTETKIKLEGNLLKLVSLQYKTQSTEMEQILNEARGEHAKAG